MEEIHQVIAKFLDGKHKILNFKTPEISISSLKARIQELTSIPAHHQLLLSDGKTLDDSQTLTLTKPTTKNPIFPTTITLLLRLRGGKGGFGSLLRGAATKAGQKKTNNFDACRDMSGRRLRHVNMEKKVEEWNAEAKGRELEKIAEEYIKKQVKLAKKSGKGGDGGAERYVEKYRLDSAKCMEEVDKCVRESLGGGVGLKGKRKVGVVVGKGDGSRVKRLKIWKGKRKVDDSDSDDADDSDSDSDAEDDGNDEETGEEIEKSVVINNENHLDSSKGADQSSGSVTGEKADAESSVGCSSESGSEEEDGRVRPVHDFDDGSFNGGSDNTSKQVLEINERKGVQNKDSNVATVSVDEAVLAELEKTNKAEVGNVEETICQVPSITTAAGDGVSNIEDGSSDIIPVADVEAVAASSGGPDLDRPLNFDDFSSAAEMEVLGLERLKSELQARGLKCGGTLHERAARLFLLKTTPLEMLPKKLLARK